MRDLIKSPPRGIAKTVEAYLAEVEAREEEQEPESPTDLHEVEEKRHDQRG